MKLLVSECPRATFGNSHHRKANTNDIPLMWALVINQLHKFYLLLILFYYRTHFLNSVVRDEVT